MRKDQTIKYFHWIVVDHESLFGGGGGIKHKEEKPTKNLTPVQMLFDT